MVANHVGADQTLVDALLQKAKEEIGYNINQNDIRYLTMLKKEVKKESNVLHIFII